MLGKHVAADSMLAFLWETWHPTLVPTKHIFRIIYIYTDEIISFRDGDHYSL